jgi:hypothetical protein
MDFQSFIQTLPAAAFGFMTLILLLDIAEQD